MSADRQATDTRYPNSPGAGRIDTLTGLRGYLALWVMAFHFSSLSGATDYITHRTVTAYAGGWRIETFFVISGFALSYVYDKSFNRPFTLAAYLRYLGMRLGRLYPLHAVTLTALVVMYLVGSHVGFMPTHTDKFQLQALPWHYLMLQAWGFTDSMAWNPVAWALSAEWFACLFLLPLYARAFANVPARTVALSALLVWLIFFATGAIDVKGNYLHASHDALGRITAEFLAGYAAYRIWCAHSNWRQYSDSLLLVGLLGTLGFAYKGGYSHVLVIPCIAAMVLGLAYAGPLARALFVNRVSIFLGVISYSIYMIHPMVRIAWNFIVRRLHFLEGSLTAWVILIGATATTIMLAVLSYYLVEKPLRDLVAKAIRRRWTDPVLAGKTAAVAVPE